MVAPRTRGDSANRKLTDVLGERRLNHRAELTTGVLADERGELLREFFRQRRKNALRLAEAGEAQREADDEEDQR